MNPTIPTQIFIAEDSEYLAEILVRSLDAMPGLSVVGQARTGQQAIAGIRALEPDLVLLDLSLPDGSGFHVLEALQPAGRRPFFIILTLHTQDAFREQATQLGAHIFLDKASGIQRLLDALHVLAGRNFDLAALREAFSHDHQLAL